MQQTLLYRRVWVETINRIPRVRPTKLVPTQLGCRSPTQFQLCLLLFSLLKLFGSIFKVSFEVLLQGPSIYWHIVQLLQWNILEQNRQQLKHFCCDLRLSCTKRKSQEKFGNNEYFFINALSSWVEFSYTWLHVKTWEGDDGHLQSLDWTSGLDWWTDIKNHLDTF